MKYLTLLTVPVLLSASLTASSSDGLEDKFGQQASWSKVRLVSSSRSGSLTGYETTKGKIRIDFDSSQFFTTPVLEISAEKQDLAKFEAACDENDELLRTKKLQAFSKLSFNFPENPLSPHSTYTIDHQRSVQLLDVENYPAKISYTVVYGGGKFTTLDRNYEAHVKAVGEELNEQFKSQFNGFHTLNEGVKFSLDSFKEVACKIYSGDMNIKILYTLEAEVAKAKEVQWITKKDFEKLYSELQAPINNGYDKDLFRVGITLGRSLAKTNELIRVDQNARDYRLLTELYTTKTTASGSSYKLKELDPVKFEKVHGRLAEIKGSQSLVNKYEPELVYDDKVQLEWSK